MEIEELIKLSLLYHDIDKEKIRKNVLKNTRNKVITKRVLLTIAIAVLAAIPVLALSFGFAKDNTPSPSVASDATIANVVDVSENQSQTESAMSLVIPEGKIVAAQDEDYFERYELFLSDKLSKAFEKCEDNAEFLISVQYESKNFDSYIYIGKTIKDYGIELEKAKTEYNDIKDGYKEGSIDKAKEELEEAEYKYNQAIAAGNKSVFLDVSTFYSEKSIEILSSDQKAHLIDIVSTKDKIIEITKNISEESDITYHFKLGSNSDLLPGQDFFLFD